MSHPLVTPLSLSLLEFTSSHSHSLLTSSKFQIYTSSPHFRHILEAIFHPEFALMPIFFFTGKLMGHPNWSTSFCVESEWVFSLRFRKEKDLKGRLPSCHQEHSTSLSSQVGTRLLKGRDWIFKSQHKRHRLLLPNCELHKYVLSAVIVQSPLPVWVRQAWLAQTPADIHVGVGVHSSEVLYMVSFWNPICFFKITGLNGSVWLKRHKRSIFFLPISHCLNYCNIIIIDFEIQY